MNESEFLKTLQRRASEQEKLIRGIPFPKIFLSLSLWLGNHPMRIIAPLAIIITLILHNLFGKNYDNFILKIFSKL